jgi:apolipoprotein N-acyltransferase
VKHATRWPPFVLFLLPLLWMLIQVARRRFAKDATGLAFLVGALVYAALWITIGKIDEVRIFMPFALALVPLTTQMAMLRLRDSEQQLDA